MPTKPRLAPQTLRSTPSLLGLTSGVANIIMQLSLPPVGEGVSESRVVSGSPRRYPIKRARTTGQYLAIAVFGNENDRRVMREAVAEIHRHVHSTADSPVRYSGNAVALQLWVAACLFRFYLDQHTLVHGDLTNDELDVLTASAAPLATGVNVRPEQWPSNWAEFDAYWNQTLEKLSISPEVHRDLESLADLSFLAEAWGPVGRIISTVAGRSFHFFTRGNLPPEFRTLMRWSWSREEDRRFARFLRGIRLLDRLGGRHLVRSIYWLYIADFRLRHRLGLPSLGRLRVSTVRIRDGAGLRWRRLGQTWQNDQHYANPGEIESGNRT